MEELRFTLSGNDPVNNTYCRIANMVLINKDNVHHIKDHIWYTLEQFINRYKFIPKIEIMDFTNILKNVDQTKIIEMYEELKKYIGIESQTKVDSVTCACGEIPEYCTCNIIDKVVFEDPDKKKGSDFDINPLVKKLEETKQLAKDLGYQLDLNIIDRKFTLARAGVNITLSFENLTDGLDEVIDFLDGNV